MDGGRVRESAAAFAETAQSPNLRRAQLSFGSAFTSEWAVTVALGILAFRDGGAAAVGAVTLARILPSALLAPFMAGYVDRNRRDHVLVVVCLARGLALLAAALVLGLSGEPLPAYVLAAVATLAHTLVRPAHSALLPSLCTTPSQLTSANVVRGLLDSLSALLGPLAAGLLVGPIGVDGVLAVSGVASLWSAWLVARLRYEAAPRAERAPERRAVQEAVAGFLVIAERADVRLLCGLTLIQTFTRGCFTVFAVVIAIDLLEIGESGVGLLTAAVGAGAVFGSFATTLLVGQSGFARWVGVGVILWGVPFAVIALFTEDYAAFALLMIVGIGNAIVDVALFTTLNQLVPDEVMGRFFASFESLIQLSVAAGGPAAALFIELFGARGALVAAGAFGPVAVLLVWTALRRLDIRLRFSDRVMTLLQRVPMLRPLPLATIARLAALVNGREASAGTVVIEEGELGDDFFVIARGDAQVLKEGRVICRLGPGDCFGEIAVLSSSPRTSTVRAETDLKLLRLRGEHFVNVVSGYTPSKSAATALVAERLARG